MSGSFLNNKNIILIFFSLFCPLQLLMHFCGGYKNGKKHQEMHIPVAH